MRRLLLVLAVTASACSGRGSGAGIQVDVTFGPRSRAKCITLVAKKGTLELHTDPMQRGMKTTLQVGILKKNGLDGTIDIRARGFLDTACNESQLNEESATVQATFV